MKHVATRLGALGAAVVVIASLAPMVLGARTAAAQTGPGTAATTTGSFSVSPRSGPVGTVVHLSGDVQPSCLVTSTGPRTVFLEFEKGSEQGQPNEWIDVPLAPNGHWAATYVIPSYVGGQAMTQGSLGGDVTPGTWQFLIPQCNATVAVGFTVTGTVPVPSRFVGMAPTPDGKGYWLAQAGGGVFSYGDARFHGSLPSIDVDPAAPITGIAATPDGGGYWLVGTDGGVFAFGDARYYGSLPQQGVSPSGAITGIAATPDGGGYWLVGADGGVFAFGDAAYLGNGRDGVRKMALLPTPHATGYLLTTGTGLPPVATGDAVSYQHTPMPLAAPLSGGAILPDGKGYWEDGTDGGVFAFGDAGFYGSLPSEGIVPRAPVVGMARTPDGGGYWLVGADGGVFAFGDAGFYGSAGSTGLPW